MGVVKTADLEPGMTLECDVKDRSGRLLLRANSEITGKYLHTFKAWGITEVRIKGAADETSPAGDAVPDIDPATLQAARDEAVHLFSRANIEHPLVRELFGICVTRIALRPQAGK